MPVNLLTAEDASLFATAAQGSRADSALQPDDVAGVVISGISDDLTEGVLKLLMTPEERAKIIDLDARLSQLSVRRTLRSFGAVGNGSANDAEAINAARASGLPLTGEGLTYGYAGKFIAVSGMSLHDATIKQLSPGSSLSVTTIEASGTNNLDLRRVKVDRNGDGTNGGMLNASGDNGALNTAFGIRIIGGTGHHLEDLEVFGDDSGTGIYLSGLDGTSRVIRPYVHDMKWARNAAEDDQIQGIWINNCDNLIVERPLVKNLLGTLNGVSSRRFTRGIPGSENSSVILLCPQVETCDQGVDWTGQNNDDCRIVAPVVNDLWTWGVKLANAARRTVVSDGVARNCGVGFVASGNAALTKTTDRNVFVDCVSYNAGSNGQAVIASAGFRVLSGGTEAGSGARTKFVRCRHIDEQATKTADYGFMSEITDLAYAPIMEDCESIGHAVAPSTGLFKKAERGSNGNGEYVKLLDGTLICTHRIDLTGSAISTARGTQFSLASAITWNFPQTFAVAPTVRPDVERNDMTVKLDAQPILTGNNSVNINVWASAAVAAGDAKALVLSATGRWF